MIRVRCPLAAASPRCRSQGSGYPPQHRHHISYLPSVCPVSRIFTPHAYHALVGVDTAVSAALAGVWALGGHDTPCDGGTRGPPLQAGAASPSWCPSPGRCPPVAHILLIHVTESLECPEPSQGGLTMTRFLLSVVLGMSTALGLLLLLLPGETAVVAKTLAQTPVTGRLADGGTFQGRLTLQALRFDEAGQLIATGVLSGTATPAAGRAARCQRARLPPPSRCSTCGAPAGPSSSIWRRSPWHHLCRNSRWCPWSWRPRPRRRRSASYRGRSVRWRASRSNTYLSHRRAASWERGPVRAAWSMRACARAQDHQGPGARPCLPPRPHVSTLFMREDGHFSTPLLYQRAACLARLPGGGGTSGSRRWQGRGWHASCLHTGQAVWRTVASTDTAEPPCN